MLSQSCVGIHDCARVPQVGIDYSTQIGPCSYLCMYLVDSEGRGYEDLVMEVREGAKVW